MTTDCDELIAVLRGGRQCDEEGVEIIMSRQACCEAANMLTANAKEIQILQAEVDLYRAACDRRDAAMVIVGWRNPLNGVVISDHRKKSISIGNHYPNFSEPVYSRTDIQEK